MILVQKLQKAQNTSQGSCGHQMYEGWIFQTLTSSQKLIGAETFLSSKKLDKKFFLSLVLFLSKRKKKKTASHLLNSLILPSKDFRV
jgi:hypothetical protein